MNFMKNIIGLVAVSAAFSLANDSFGGIGVTYKTVENGAQIVDVIPGTPASDSKIKSGDVIISVDDSCLKGMKAKDVRSILRGLENKPVVLKYVSEGDTLVETIRRIQLIVGYIDSFANAEIDGKKLLAILSEGKVVDERDSAKISLKGVYVDNTDLQRQASSSQMAEFAKICGFSREHICVQLDNSAYIIVSVADASGNIVFKTVEAHANAGVNTILWNGSEIPEGRYVISVECNGMASGINVMLK